MTGWCYETNDPSRGGAGDETTGRNVTGHGETDHLVSSGGLVSFKFRSFKICAHVLLAQLKTWAMERAPEFVLFPPQQTDGVRKVAEVQHYRPGIPTLGEATSADAR